MEKLENRLAKKLRMMRGETSMRQFTRKLGVSVSTLHRMELGEQNVTLTTLGLLCLRLKCDVGDLFAKEVVDSKETLRKERGKSKDMAE